MTLEQNNSRWYPTDEPSTPLAAASNPWRRDPGVGAVSESDWFTACLDPGDYGERRGFVGDIPAPGAIRRMASVLIDGLLTLYLPLWVLTSVGVGYGYSFVVALALMAVNAAGYRPQYGQTVGKRLLRIQAVRAIRTREGKQALVQRGPVLSVLRAYLHCFDVSLWPIAIVVTLLSRKHRTLADLLTHTVLIHPAHIEPLQPAPRHATTLT